MSKSTKIIAALGVVAGLGVSALPLTTYAKTQSVNGNAVVVVEVEEAIAMTIKGNNDDKSHYDFTETGVTADDDGVDVYSPTGASTIDGHTVKTLSSENTVASSSWINLLPASSAHGSDTNGFKSTIKVYTNANGGYTLSVKDADSDLNLTQVVASGTAETIPAGATIKAGTAAWGYSVDTALAANETDGTTYTAIKATDEVIKTRNSKTNGGEETKVYYGVSTANDQATGVYKDTIVYTATTK